jgi:TetR/AcrR family transcriptional regulator
MGRRRLSSEDRRRQLIDQAVKLVSQRGFSGTRTKDIAAACGVSEGILFRHFATKEDLYRAILESHADEAGSREWLREMKRLAAARDDRGLVNALVQHLLRNFRENAAFHRLMLYAWLEGHAMASMAHQQLGQPMFDFLRKYVSQRQREGAFRSGDPAAIVITLYSPALQFAMTKYVFGMQLSQPEDELAVKQFVDILLAGIRSPQTLTKARATKKRRFS